jgi:RNA polymerase sigma-70 factor (ECF subfamily)
MEKRIEFNQEKTLELLAQGNEYAFTQVFDSYYPRVYGAALKLLRSRELAKDIAQEVFLKVWDKRITFTEVLNLEAFVFTMARNLTLNQLEKLANERVAQYKFISDLKGVTDNTDHALAEQQYEQLLQETLALLPPQQKRVYELSRIEGLNHEDIARQLNISHWTVNNHISCALKFIRLHLKPHLGSLAIPILLQIFDQQ